MKLITSLAILMLLVIVSSVLAFDEPDLVFYFPFEEFDGATALDQSGKGHNGTVNGDVQIVDGGKFGKAAQFAAGGFIDMDGPNFPEADIPRDQITLCAWINCTKNGGHHAIFNSRAADGTWIMHPEARSEGNFRWLLRSDGGATIFDIRAGTVAWGDWTFFAGLYDGKKGKLYINGEKVAEMNGGAKIAKDWGQGARIGKNVDEARPFTGLMDELSMWKRALTEDEITAIMNDGVETFLAVSPEGSLATTWGAIRKF